MGELSKSIGEKGEFIVKFFFENILNFNSLMENPSIACISKDENSDLQISIELLLNKVDKNPKTENTIRQKLLELFETKKIESYKRLNNKQ